MIIITGFKLDLHQHLRDMQFLCHLLVNNVLLCNKFFYVYRRRNNQSVIIWSISLKQGQRFSVKKMEQARYTSMVLHSLSLYCFFSSLWCLFSFFYFYSSTCLYYIHNYTIHWTIIVCLIDRLTRKYYLEVKCCQILMLNYVCLSIHMLLILRHFQKFHPSLLINVVSTTK